MILNISERTDIVAFYFPWFLNRLKEGFAYVRNPYYQDNVSKVILTKDNVEAIVFTTKNPIPLEKSLEEFMSYQIPFGVCVTITPYGSEIETNIKSKKEIVQSFISISKKIGKEKMTLRYDPIFLNQKYTVDYHIYAIEKLFSQVVGYTDTCIISFIDLYSFLDKKYSNMTENDIYQLMEKISLLAVKYNITLQTCAEKIDLTNYGILKKGCIDRSYLEKITGKSVKKISPRTTRENCLCTETVDLGVYNTCPHGCTYCYASSRKKDIAENIKLHDQNSPFLIGSLKEGDKIIERKNIQILDSVEQIKMIFE